MRTVSKVGGLAVAAALTALVVATTAVGQGIGTRAQREQLADEIIQKTLDREAFSSIKNRLLDFDPIEEMTKLRSDVIEASSEAELFFALRRMSNARRDRHLSVHPAPGGITPDAEYQKALRRLGATHERVIAPVRLAVDFSEPARPRLFVAELGLAEASDTSSAKVGDWVTHVNGRSTDELWRTISPFRQYSTRPNLWVRLAVDLTTFSRDLPPEFYGPQLVIRTQNKAGDAAEHSFAYADPQEVRWPSDQSPKYPGFERVLNRESFDAYRPKDERRSTLLLLDWYGFRQDLPAAVDKLVAYAEKHELLGCDLLIDLTRARGGSRGAYALRRLSPSPFKTTFGNLRLSDAAVSLIQAKRREHKLRRVLDRGVSETDDNGTWQLQWLNTDVTRGLQAGQRYSNDVPFKCAHAPHYSDGLLQPAQQHFTGRLICWLSPYGGSHLDQFAAMVVDNNLGWTIGMPSGGYSNTWEHEEVLKLPGNGRPLVRFMWSIGHTIRPNGQVLEGNPAAVHEWFPVTRDNHANYRALLLEKSIARLDRPQGD